MLASTKSLKSWQSAWLSGFGGWPETIEVRGEVFLPVAAFRELNERLTDRDVVVVALVTRCVVVLEQRAVGGKRLRQIGVCGGFAERRGVVLVLQHDHEDVADFGRLVGARARIMGCGRRGGRSGGGHATTPQRR